MSGETWEYVAAYYDNGTSNLAKYGTTDLFEKMKQISKN